MKKDLCELVVIIDESGSMTRIANDTIGGYNTFIETHKKLPGEAKMTLIKFDTKYEIIHNGVDIHLVKPLDNFTYSPGGMTALLDAVGRAIDEVSKRYDALKKKDKPGKVIFVIMTDGEENSSKEYKIEQVKEKTKKRQEEDKWEFIFLGADQDAWTVGGGMGIKSNVNYTLSDTFRTMKAAAYYTMNSRSFSKQTSLDNFNLSDAQLDAELKKIDDQNNSSKT